jgi:hypothetical protein
MEVYLILCMRNLPDQVFGENIQMKLGRYIAR